jgi:hypothetical protein
MLNLRAIVSGIAQLAVFGFLGLSYDWAAREYPVRSNVDISALASGKVAYVCRSVLEIALTDLSRDECVFAHDIRMRGNSLTYIPIRDVVAAEYQLQPAFTWWELHGRLALLLTAVGCVGLWIAMAVLKARQGRAVGALSGS